MAPTPKQRQAIKAKQLTGKAPKARVLRYLKKTEPQLRETGKSTLLLKGIKCSQAMASVLKELHSLARPNAKLLSHKNQIVAFEGHQGQQSLEFLTTKNDCALFTMASHNKKRPNNLVLGRTFNHQVLDMVEFGVLYFKSMNDYGGTVPKKRIGSKPMMLFCGDVWQQQEHYRQLQNLLVDFYRGDVVDKLVVSGLDHIMVFTAVAGGGGSDDGGNPTTTTKIHQRTYFCKLKKDPSSTTPVPYLTSCGPDMDLVLRRTQWAAPDLYKASRQQPRELRPKSSLKRKNQSTNVFGETIGRLHLAKQDVDKRQGRKVKALRRAEKQQHEEDQAAIEQELAKEKEQDSKEFQQTFGFDSA